MSRKRSDAAIQAYAERFAEGAAKRHGASREVAERVWDMISGFAGFGFPKAHGAAFGLLAYQSTWLRVHHPAAFLCALLDEQPMGFYIPDALVHEAQRRGLTVLAPEINASGVECTLEPAGDERDGGSPSLSIRIGMAYVKGVRADEIAALVAARESGGPFTSLGDLGARAGAGRASLELLAWSGACDALAGGDRRTVLWQLGIASPGRRVPGGTQLALPLELPAPPALERMDAWPEMLADYATTGLTVNGHPLGLLRPSLPADAVTSADLKTLPHGHRVRIGGLVVARQRPGTANGIVFLLTEDEHGTVNLIVPPNVYERHRVTTRTEPLILAEGRLERHPAAGGGINVLVDRLRPIDVPDRPLAEVKDFSMLDEKERRRRLAEDAAKANDAEEAGEFRAVAPPVMSFASGRRR